MDLSELEAFLTVARMGSFTTAASALHRSQPGVSRQVRRLEKELGVSLLDRRGGSVRVTTAGEQALRFAEDTLDRFNRLRASLRDDHAVVRGKLNIAASTTPGQFLVPTLVAGYRELHPGVQAEIAIMDSTNVAADVREGGCDVGFIGIKYPDRRLHYQVIAQDEIVLAVPRGHRFAGQHAIAVAELAGERFLEREEGSGTRACVLQALAEAGKTMPAHDVAMVLGTTEAVVSAVEQEHGVGWVSSLALIHRDTARVALVRIRDVPILRPLYLVHRRRTLLSPAAADFADWVARTAPASVRP